ncbi:GH24533 [Drosophila grimshawi]|uniref:GH24533 n=2 Tax=Drosophila grimshawi TaxID=7222 RepID=B4JLW1_DROGR|nr:GH24533 [Drosophila grimshawi]
MMNYTDSQNENVIDDYDTTNTPERMALMAADRSDRGSSSSISGPSQFWQSDHAGHWVEEKPSKLQTLFQISITALAFLSFGGYLLCLIVQAIKSKGTTYFHPVATATTTSTNGSVKRIKIYRRSKRSIILPDDYVTYMRSIRGQRRDHAYLVGS